MGIHKYFYVIYLCKPRPFFHWTLFSAQCGQENWFASSLSYKMLIITVTF
jgi:hypothetical protein